MTVTTHLRRLLALAAVLLVAAGWGDAANANYPLPPDRPSRVVVTVDDGSFQWGDAGIGAAATFAVGLAAVGLQLALRAERRGNRNP